MTQRRENALLERTEVHFTIAHPAEGTPARSEIRKTLAAVLNAKDGVVVLDWARSEFGKTGTRGYAKVYRSKERALALETSPILIRNGLKQAAAKKEAAPKEAPAAPAAKPEKKEATPEAPKAEAPKKEAVPKPAAKETTAPPKPVKEPAKKEEAPKEKKPAAKKEGK